MHWQSQGCLHASLNGEGTWDFGTDVSKLGGVGLVPGKHEDGETNSLLPEIFPLVPGNEGVYTNSSAGKSFWVL